MREAWPILAHRQVKQLSLAFCALTVLFCLPALAQEDSYRRATAAIAEGDWVAAVGHLTAALEVRNAPSSDAQGAGYYPYLLLGVAYIELEQYEMALSALDTSERFGASLRDEDTRRQLTEARARAEQGLLGGQQEPAAEEPAPDAAPVIRLSPHLDTETGTLTMRRRSLALSGVVVDEGPVDVAVFRNGQPSDEPTLQTQKAGDSNLTTFELDLPIDTASLRVEIVATDRASQVTRSELTVAYLPPWYSDWRVYLAAVVVAGLAAATLLYLRARRRAQLITRKFNPYVAGPPLRDSDLFVGREPLIERVLQTVHNNSLLLYGEKGIGKTSLLYQIKHRLGEIRDPDYVFYPVFVDLRGVEESRFFGVLATRVLEELDDQLDDLEIVVAEDARMNSRSLVRILRKVLRYLQKGNEKRVKLVLLLDDVDTLNDYDPAVNQQLRSLFMKSFADKLVAVVSGIEIKHHWESVGSPWYNFFEEIEVPPLELAAVEELIRRPIQGVFGVEKELAERIWKTTEGRPFRIQQLCLNLVSRLHEAGRATITVADLEELGAADEG